MNAQPALWEKLARERVPLRLAGNGVPWVVDARQSAFARGIARGLPTRQEEDWKYTDISPITRRETLVPDQVPHDASSEAALHAWALSHEHVHLMVFVDGHYSPELSAQGELPAGVSINSLASQLDLKADGLLQTFFDAHHEHTAFTALNSAFATDGAVIDIAAGTEVVRPIYLLFIASGSRTSVYPRNIVIAHKGAHATVIEHYFGVLEANNFVDVVTQINLAEGAEVSHCKLVQEGKNTSHVAGIHAEQASHSRFVSQSFVLDGRLVRNDITSQMLGEDCQCTLEGIYLAGGRQHVDHHTRIDHIGVRGISREDYRGVLDGEAHGVFNGKVVVHPGAVKTDAHQSNRNLLLSPQAEIDTKPELEIYADDVKCTHGATVGQLDEDQLFYLRTRGVDASLARTFLIYGFVNDIVGRVAVANMRTRIEQLVLDRLAQSERIKEVL